MKVTGEVNTGPWEPIDDGPVTAPRPNRYNELSNLVRPEAQPNRPLPVQTPANEALGQLVGGLMAEARTIHTADPLTRGKAMLLKTTAITVFLSLLTLAALVMLDSLAFSLWLFLASLEWVVCFLFLAYNDWREHPSSVRWLWSNRLLDMMQEEQRARLKAQYGDWDK